MPYTGIIFAYCDWSPAKGRLPIIKNMLQEFSTPIELLIWNIDGDEFKTWSAKHDVKSHGNGEVFWIFEDEIVDGLFQNRKFKQEFQIKMQTYVEEYLS